MKRKGFFELFRDQVVGAPKGRKPEASKPVKKREEPRDTRKLDPTMADLEPHRYRRR
jgi:hypothetical protein